ncbi:MAG: type II secretion system F family protein [Pirellulales bacterium]|nr:type II secretion system F family protein [Pirellulales bacterium]
MFFAPRIQLKPLIALCRRAGTSLEAGVDIRTVFARERDRTAGHLRRHLAQIAKDLEQGESLADALREADDFFPLLFRELVEVGEQTGNLDEVLGQLAEHYETRLTMRRNFLAAITWPMAQLGIALGVIGFLIWIMGMMPKIDDKPIDILGCGLIGNRGLTIYLVFLAVMAAAIWVVVRAVARGMLWTRSIQQLVLRLPGLGGPLQTMALARLAWSMHLTMNTGMEVRRALRLSLRSARNARYTDQIPAIDAAIEAGHSIHEAFCAAGGYPADFLDTLAVGEESGKIVDSMGILSRQYQERARMALAALTVLAGWAVWGLVAAMIILMIFRLFSFYIGAIGGAMP